MSHNGRLMAAIESDRHSGARPRSAPTSPITTGPVGVLDILDGGFAVLRQAPLMVIASILVVALPVALLTGWLQRDLLGGYGLGDVVNDPVLLQSATVGGTEPLTMVLPLLPLAVSGVMMTTIVMAWYEGRSVTLGVVLAHAARRSPVLAVAWLISHLGAVFVIPIVMGCLVSPVVAAEGLGPWASIKRSWLLVRRRLGTTLLVMILLGIIDAITASALGLLPSSLALWLGPSRAWFLVSLGEILSRTVMLPVQGAVMALLYMDCRFRSEGLDLVTRTAETFGGPSRGV